MVTTNKVYCILFDSGSSKTLIHKHFVSHNYMPIQLDDGLQIFSLAGTTKSSDLVDLHTLHKIRFPKFNHNMIINKHLALIVDSTSLCYAIIFGADFLDKCRITLNYDKNLVCWMEYDIPLFHFATPLSFFIHLLFLTPIEITFEEDCLGNTYVDSFATHILDAKYEHVNIHDIASNQHHLSLNQWHDLFNILSKHKKIFNGSLGVFPHKKVHIDLKPGKNPHHCTYPVPHPPHPLTNFQKGAQTHNLGILEPCGATEWASPAFIIPNKDGLVWHITDLHLLNNAVIQKQYHLPIITDIMDWISRYNFFTKLDIYMQYYTFGLDKPSQELHDICYCHTIWQTQIQMFPHGTQMCPWLCPGSHGESFTWHQQHWCPSWQYCCLLLHLRTPHLTHWQNTKSIRD